MHVWRIETSSGTPPEAPSGDLHRRCFHLKYHDSDPAPIIGTTIILRLLTLLNRSLRGGLTRVLRR